MTAVNAACLAAESVARTGCINAARPQRGVPESLCRRHVERVVASVTFARAEQLRHLLKWLADRALESNADAPSEREIAVAVLNRRDFDPQTDSLVRKEMSRLREKLIRYYGAEGRQDDIRIMTGGGYLIGFESCGSADPVRGRVCWLMLPFRSGPSLTELSEELLEELLVAVGDKADADLVPFTTAMAYRGRFGDLRQFAAECSADFVVEGSLRRRNDLIEVTMWLIDGQTGRTLRSHRIKDSNCMDLARVAGAWLLEQQAE